MHCSKSCGVALTAQRTDNISDAAAVRKFEIHQKDASSIIMSALKGTSLRVVRSVVGTPIEILEN